MIKRIRIENYRALRSIDFAPHPSFNVLVGENEGGKSTLLEAIGLALTGRLDGRSAADELNPYWFNQAAVSEFYAERKGGGTVAPPEIRIEVFLEDRDEFQRSLAGAHNSEVPTRECAGLTLQVAPDPEHSAEFEAHVASGSTLLPVEYYKVEWRSFADVVMTSRPKDIRLAFIDSRTVRSSSGIDYHLRQILRDHLEPEDRAAVSLAFRAAKEGMTSGQLKTVNEKMANIEGPLEGEKLSLAMDQSARGAWDSSVVPHVADIPFGMAGQGQQAAVKIALAMSNKASGAGVVMMEEPENHLSHTSLNKLLNRIQKVASDAQQVFVTTHSSFVLNRLGLDGLVFVSGGRTSALGDVPAETVSYFQKLSGYDTLRMVLCDRFVLVEGPSDEIVFERFYLDATRRRPIEDGVDVVSMRGLSLRRCLELATVLQKKCVAVRDNDGHPPTELVDELGELTNDTQRPVFIGQVDKGHTLELQILSHNQDDALMRHILGVTQRANLEKWMTNNKTEAALRIAESDMTLTPPAYIQSAIGFIRASAD